MATVAIQQDNKKAIQQYQHLLNKLKDKHQVHAKKYVPQLCEILKNAGWKNENIRDKVTRDASKIWAKPTIRDALPSYLKDASKAKAGEASGRVRAKRTKYESSVKPEQETYDRVTLVFTKRDTESKFEFKNTVVENEQGRFKIFHLDKTVSLKAISDAVST